MIKYFAIFAVLGMPFAFADDVDVYVASDTNIPGCQDDDSCWSSSSITISQHDTVTWHNQKSFSVGVMSGHIFDDDAGDMFDSGVILPDRSFSFTFDESGTFEYFSLLQPWMTGTVIVRSDGIHVDNPLESSEPVTCGAGTNLVNGLCQAAESDTDANSQTDETVTCGAGTNLVNGLCQAAESDTDANSQTDETVTCGAGTKLVNGFCHVVVSDTDANSQTDETVTCGAGTKLVNGFCHVIDNESGGGGCLVATATFGTELAPEVQKLRELRDSKLLRTEYGVSFMNSFNTVYYSFSPTVSDMERENPVFREGVKIFITPMLHSLSIMENAEHHNLSILLWGSFVVLINGFIYVGIPLGTVVLLRKYV